MESQELTDEEISSIGTTQALEEGLSVATSKFNTERFGALSVHPNSASATNLGTANGSGTDHYRDMHPSSLQDDDFGTHGNFDDNFDDLDFAGLDEDFEVDDTAMDAEQDHPQLTASRTAAVETRSRRMIVEENSQDSSESEALREKLVEVALVAFVHAEANMTVIRKSTHNQQTTYLHFLFIFVVGGAIESKGCGIAVQVGRGYYPSLQP